MTCLRLNFFNKRGFCNVIQRELPLKGIKVLDMSRVLAGPYCTQLLGDLGADIYKIENPINGDDTRSWGPPFTSNGNESAYFLMCNRNKKSITVDIRSIDGQKIIHDLCGKCDVFVENYVPGKLRKYCLDYEYIRDNVNKSIIYASVTGFGQNGVYAQRGGYDVIVQAMTGMMHITGDDKPAKTGVALVDVITGLYGYSSILASIIARDKDPERKGQHIDLSLYDASIASLVNIGSNYLIGNVDAKRWGTAHVLIYVIL